MDISNCSDTAWWDPAQEFIFFCRDFTQPIDVMSHEYTHAVVGHLVELVGAGEPRELNEAFADIFAAFIDNETPWQVNRPVEPDGNTILRNLARPQEGYPQHYSER